MDATKASSSAPIPNVRLRSEKGHYLEHGLQIQLLDGAL